MRQPCTDGDAKRGTVIQPERLGRNDVNHALDCLLGAGFVGLDQEGGQLLPANARDPINRAHGFREPVGRAAQDGIAGGVTMVT